jgi:hypothetical protein
MPTGPRSVRPAIRNSPPERRVSGVINAGHSSALRQSGRVSKQDRSTFETLRDEVVAEGGAEA